MQFRGNLNAYLRFGTDEGRSFRRSAGAVEYSRDAIGLREKGRIDEGKAEASADSL